MDGTHTHTNWSSYPADTGAHRSAVAHQPPGRARQSLRIPQGSLLEATFTHRRNSHKGSPVCVLPTMCSVSAVGLSFSPGVSTTTTGSPYPGRAHCMRWVARVVACASHKCNTPVTAYYLYQLEANSVVSLPRKTDTAM